jgi:NADPH2:quinone reductase
VRHGPPAEALRLENIDPPQPGSNQIRVRSHAGALNFNEIDGCYGRYLTINPPLPYTLGMELVGTVEAAGPGQEGWIGKRVMATGSGAIGAHAEQVVADVDMVFQAPEALDDSQAAAFYFPFHVAHIALLERAGLTAGETLLVHAAAGGVGSAAVQLGVAMGARVIATAGSAAKLALCRELGADVAIDYRSQDFVAAVLDATNGRGVDVCCDLVGGQTTQRSFECMALHGRLMLTGFSGGIEAEDQPWPAPRPIVFGNFSVGGVLLSYRRDPLSLPRSPGVNIGWLPRSTGDAVQAHLVELLAAGKLRPVIGRAADYDDLPGEYERMERRETLGRTILHWS